VFKLARPRQPHLAHRLDRARDAARAAIVTGAASTIGRAVAARGGVVADDLLGTTAVIVALHEAMRRSPTSRATAYQTTTSARVASSSAV
jgi:hypothetical protein